MVATRDNTQYKKQIENVVGTNFIDIALATFIDAIKKWDKEKGLNLRTFVYEMYKSRCKNLFRMTKKKKYIKIKWLTEEEENSSEVKDSFWNKDHKMPWKK